MDELPPCPYTALGIPKDATLGSIKSAYRKLVLTCHPDKVKDESLKEQKAAEFHKIQSAYDLIGEQEGKEKYDALLKLTELRKAKEALEKEKQRSAPTVEVRTAGYEFRSSPPQSSAAFTSRGPARFEERRPRGSYDDYDEQRNSSRKFEGYERRSPPMKTSREPERVKVTSRDSERSSRRERDRVRDREEKRERRGKYASYGSDDESDRPRYDRYEDDIRRRSDEDIYRKKYSEQDREEAEARRYTEGSRKQGSSRETEHSDWAQQFREAQYYQEQSRQGQNEIRPQPIRISSSRQGEVEYRRSNDRPEAVRRSSARPRERTHESSRRRSSDREHGRERRPSLPEIVEERRPPTLQSHTSSPPVMRNVRLSPQQRSHTFAEYERVEVPKHPTIRRAETMPTQHTIPSAVPSSSSRRRDAVPANSSRLRNSESVHDSGYASPSEGVTRKYYYGTENKIAGGVPLEDYTNGHRVITREPSGSSKNVRTHSPSPIRERDRERERDRPSSSRPHTTTAAPRYAEPTRSNSYAAYDDRPQDPRRPTVTHVRPPPPQRENTAMYYGEIPKERYPPEKVSFGKRYGYGDIKFSGRESESRRREAESGFSRPTIPRSATHVY